MAEAVFDEKKSSFSTLLKSPDIQFAIGLIGVILLMVIPLPPFILDILLAISITIGFLVLLVAIYVDEPIDFSTFPTISNRKMVKSHVYNHLISKQQQFDRKIEYRMIVHFELSIDQ